MVFKISITILWIVLGFITTYVKTRTDIIETAEGLIAQAEEAYSDVSKSGSLKMKYVVSIIMNMIPKPLQMIFNEEMVETICQSVFDSIDAYAKVQLDKVFRDHKK